MELKASLNKPYSEEQRINFIVEQNHLFGYEIKETEEALESWGYTQEEIAQQEVARQREEIIAQLNAIDLKTIRSMRAIQSADFTDDDVAYLQQLEQQAKALREQLSALDD